MINQEEITMLEIRIKTSMLRSDLWNYSDAYIVMKGDITLVLQIMQKK